MITPSWWAIVWIQELGDAEDVVAVNDWGAVATLRAGMPTRTGSWSWEVYDHRGRLVQGTDSNGSWFELTAPIDGGPVRMRAPMTEGRWLWSGDDDGTNETWTRLNEPPTRQVVEWLSTPEPRQAIDGDVLVVPYDIDPNPLSISLRLRKRIWKEAFERQQPKP